MTRPSILIASGLDPSGGAGFLADVRLVERLGGRAVGAVTALTVQDTVSVRGVVAMDADAFGESLRVLLADVEVAAGKIGMLANPGIAEALVSALALTGAPCVWDPVLVSSSGAPLYEGAPRDLLELLRGHIALATPNLAEAAVLGGRPVDSVTSMGEAALALSEALDAAVLVTGGHLPGAPVDVLACGGAVTEYPGERIDAGGDVHGTGCALATAAAVFLARGQSLESAVSAATAVVRECVRSPARPGRGRPSVL